VKLEKRGFFSIDAFFALTLLLAVTASFLNIYHGRRATADIVDAKIKAKAIGERLASAMNATYACGPGFELHINLPENLGKHSYRITFDNTARQISVENSAWGAIRVGVACGRVQNFILETENLRKPIRVLWRDNQVTVVNT
jgi:hypothetical protein